MKTPTFSCHLLPIRDKTNIKEADASEGLLPVTIEGDNKNWRLKMKGSSLCSSQSGVIGRLLALGRSFSKNPEMANIDDNVTRLMFRTLCVRGSVFIL
jgi:hypothetical protein